jgi:intein/homing endonuclease
MKKVLELFAGSRSIGKAAESLGMEVFSVDWEQYEGINLSKDIGELTMEDVPFTPNIVWASPDCTTYTIAAISHHRNGTEPKSEYAIKCDGVNQHFISLIKEWLNINPNMVFFIENPRGMLRKMPWIQEFTRHTIWYCFVGETEVITKLGSQKFSDIVNTTQSLLMKDGTWKDAPIRHYGKQQIYKLTLSRAGMTKVIRTTKNHKWIIRLPNKREVIVNTIDLKTKDIIPSIYGKHTFEFMENEGIARGFVFGDGYANYKGKRIPYDSAAQFCGAKDEEMVKYFDNMGRSRRKNKGHLNIHGLPFEWKTEIPNIFDYSSNYIYGWLAGYFAADGTVGKNGQVVMYSAKRKNIEAFKNLCQTIGIGTYEIREWSRKGFGKEETILYSLGLIRTTLPSEFFLLKHHRNNNFIPKFEPYWSVVSVEVEDKYEDVYCTEVEGYESFVLDGNILTHNCKYGDDRAKPTDIWTNSTTWTPRPICHNGNKECHHQPAPRGSKTGTQGRKGSYERSKIPEQLCMEILTSTL